MSDLYPTTDLWNALKSAMKGPCNPDAGPCCEAIEQVVCLAEAAMQHIADFDKKEQSERNAAYTTAASALLVSEAILHAADRLVQAINRQTQVAAGAADKALGD